MTEIRVYSPSAPQTFSHGRVGVDGGKDGPSLILWLPFLLLYFLAPRGRFTPPPCWLQHENTTQKAPKTDDFNAKNQNGHGFLHRPSASIVDVAFILLSSPIKIDSGVNLSHLVVRRTFSSIVLCVCMGFRHRPMRSDCLHGSGHLDLETPRLSDGRTDGRTAFSS